MRLRCAVLDDFQQVAKEAADWSSVTGEVDVVSFDAHLPDEDALAAALADFDIVVTLRERVAFPGSLLTRLPRLRLIVASGMRNSVIDYAAAEAHGVTVCGTASSSAPPVELTWALLLGLARGLVRESNGLREGGPWQQTVGADLHDRRLGLLGLGKIGSRVAQVGLAFGMRVSAWSQNLTRERADEVGVELAPSREELLRTADFVSVHLALGERTRGLLGPAELALLKPTAYLVNTSRAAIVDQDALLAALHEGRIAGAGVDVFDTEPLPPGHPMRTAPRLLATPHLGYVSQANYATYYGQAVEAIRSYLAGSPVRRLPAP
ncbi:MULTISPECIES: D-2-hydroxyacid dehydrogenase family protein [Streptomyces]|uniref:D-2-hydroxyacid dehydrogenase family protein n=1 Tax=Streptomyces TaxID=1883 RepID=UPI0003AB0210|nr:MULTISPECIES: D-2-hydroxyacid dehydrogenase family protein [Streptomyces]MBZ6112503.1 D-2-hydroxyacid dehydrogenase family protein [Streptomyces olivaceus]MBZ6126028.1 D-2-hydroxyacid dehydrogenase family protein [Streptomyces olivaceus]MBZ6147130.1 D-2-hydroxyacid dehydrogenase family protein [Streptomyces olivaceus]MBZ6160880.1 D-2-hydroxyacid dehydrogenase family protein [Streptomyces olivaceus]MBZ6187971.1 D-2-hydroxyacid dehydrogenase family protein [Streptomyces olivaceus]